MCGEHAHVSGVAGKHAHVSGVAGKHASPQHRLCNQESTRLYIIVTQVVVWLSIAYNYLWFKQTGKTPHSAVLYHDIPPGLYCLLAGTSAYRIVTIPSNFIATYTAVRRLATEEKERQRGRAILSCPPAQSQFRGPLSLALYGIQLYTDKAELFRACINSDFHSVVQKRVQKGIHIYFYNRTILMDRRISRNNNIGIAILV